MNLNTSFSYDFSEEISNGTLIGVMTVANGISSISNAAIAIYSNDETFYSNVKPLLSGLTEGTSGAYGWESWTDAIPTWSISGNTFSSNKIYGNVNSANNCIAIFILFYK